MEKQDAQKQYMLIFDIWNGAWGMLLALTWCDIITVLALHRATTSLPTKMEKIAMTVDDLSSPPCCSWLRKGGDLLVQCSWEVNQTPLITLLVTVLSGASVHLGCRIDDAKCAILSGIFVPMFVDYRLNAHVESVSANVIYCLLEFRTFETEVFVGQSWQRWWHDSLCFAQMSGGGLCSQSHLQCAAALHLLEDKMEQEDLRLHLLAELDAESIRIMEKHRKTMSTIYVTVGHFAREGRDLRAICLAYVCAWFFLWKLRIFFMGGFGRKEGI